MKIFVALFILQKQVFTIRPAVMCQQAGIAYRPLLSRDCVRFQFFPLLISLRSVTRFVGLSTEPANQTSSIRCHIDVVLIYAAPITK